ncbi:protein LEAD-SENSITIVE 1-like [Impatiens glandulifera]|uniref:protein LEAD-SENSITIVE 1-like n=1 Tax=Impatiens glandulifera TaxID=253017 RepID=UPI001FB11DAD|nr:protein LEAD-SENSITIVE 1-like [Impatiens glandulifera]
MGLLSHRVHSHEITAGDHIYTWTPAFAYSHHGIYVGGNKVIHFTRKNNAHFKTDSTSGFFSSSSTPSNQTSCPTFPDCGFQKNESGVVITCVNCFLGKQNLYRFQYGVTHTIFIAKLRGGTCSTAISDPPDDVIHRATHLLRHGFGNYDVFKKNCEDFALYCKTGLLSVGNSAFGGSGQVACAVSGPLGFILSAPFRLLMPNPVSMVAATAGFYYMSKYATDIGVRKDVVKVRVEDLTVVEMNKEKLEEKVDNENESNEDNHQDGCIHPFKRQRY